MTIQDLLARAAELAPDLVWYVPDDRMHKHGMIYMIGGAPLYDLDEPEAHALILYAVLKECERRGIPVSLEYDTIDGTWSLYRRAERYSLFQFGEPSNDPATAALAAFVAMLEQAKEVTT